MYIIVNIINVNIIQYVNSIYIEFRKMVMMTLYARYQKRHRYKEQSFGLCGRM